VAKTFEQMQAAMADWLGIRDADTNRLPSSVRQDIINMTQAELCRMYDFRFLEADATISITLGNSSFSLPSDWSRPYAIQYQAGTNAPTFLEQLSVEEFDVRYPADSTAASGKPLHYAIWGSTIKTGPKSDGNYSAAARYYKKLPDLANGAPNNTNDFLTNAWDVLLWACLGQGSLYGIEDNRLGTFQQRAQQAIDRLSIEHARNRTAGRRPVSQEPGTIFAPTAPTTG
jgi:hypothetical protein